MRRPRFRPAIVAVLAAFTAQAAPGATGAAGIAAPASGAILLAGTGRASIDPPPSQFPIRNNNDSPLIGVHDSLYARALVLQDAGSIAIMVVADVIILPDEFYEQAVSRISERYAVPRDHVLISATHTHTVPWTMGNGYGELVIAGMLAAIEQAQHRLEAVRIGVGDRFVDEHYGAARTETFWTSGAAGDQNPILMSFHAEPQSDGTIVNSDLKSAGFTITQRLGQALALEVIRVTDRIMPQPVTTVMRATQAVISCPSRTDPALMHSLRISYLGIGAVDLIGISGEVGTLIDRHLRDRLGDRSPVLLTLTNGYAGYLPDDASYGRGNTFEVGKSQFAPGCAEAMIIARTLELLGATPK